MNLYRGVRCFLYLGLSFLLKIRSDSTPKNAIIFYSLSARIDSGKWCRHEHIRNPFGLPPRMVFDED